MREGYFVIEGNIGSGKSTLTKKLVERNDAKIILEQFSDNPFLPLFYENPERYNFPLEMSFLTDRYKQLQNDLLQTDLFQPTIIADYFIDKCLIFSKMNLEPLEYKLYRELFNSLVAQFKKPKHLVYLHRSVDKCLSQIAKRGRTYEQSINAAYLTKIEKSYFSYFRQNQDVKVTIIDAEELDFVDNESDLELLESLIFNNDSKTLKILTPPYTS